MLHVSTKRKVHWEMVFLLASFVALAAALGAIRAGFSPDRVWPVADFLMVWAGSASYVFLASKATRRRAFRLWRTPVPRGVRLRKPIWIALDAFFMLVGLSAALGTVAAAVGFPGIGVGMALALGGVLTFPAVSGFGADLTFGIFLDSAKGRRSSSTMLAQGSPRAQRGCGASAGS